MADTTVKNELAFLQGVDTVAFFRQKSKEREMEGQLLPWQTSLSFDPQRGSDTNQTKDGVVPTTSSLETDFEVEFTNNTSRLADLMYDSLFDGEKLEAWIIYRNRRNAEGKLFAWYMQVTVSEDSNDNDPDDNSTRDVTFAVSGTPKRGWLTLPDDAQEQIDYIFRGIGKVTDEDQTGGGDAWKKEDAGVNVVTPDDAPATILTTGVTAEPISVEVGKTAKLTPVVTPPNASDVTTITYASDDEKTATVASDGTVTGVNAGATDITVTAHAAKDFTAKAHVTVTASK